MALATGASAQSGDDKKRLAVLALTEASVELTRNVTLPALAKLGFESGRNLDVRVESGPADRMPALVQRLLDGKPDAIFVIGNEAVIAAHAATKTVPIVFFGPDPVRLGIVPSLAKPSGNVTGIAILSIELNAKRLDLLREAKPSARRIAALMQRNPAAALYEVEMRDVATRAGLELLPVVVDGPADFVDAFARMRAERAEALVIASNPLLFQNGAVLASLASAGGLPTICEWPAMTQAGCLLGYGPPLNEIRAHVATIIARVLRGTKPADLPIEQPTRFELSINSKTAKTLGLVIPPALLARADEVIE
ncbi:MAG TPA: ABC transporter substrate-binding protein [Vineibacter sp.]|nr:ABC transporter substrate-binding protein [Vineibacter sp.]